MAPTVKKAAAAPQPKTTEDDVKAQENAGTVTNEDNEAATVSAREGLTTDGDPRPAVGDAHDREGFGRQTMEESVAAQVRPQRYTSGEGLKAGNKASKTLYLDEDGKVTEKQPVRGRILTTQGSPVSPTSAKIIADADNKK